MSRFGLFLFTLSLCSYTWASVSLSASGRDGWSEQDGGDAGDISVRLTQSEDQIHIRGQVRGESVAKVLSASGQVLTLYARGGDGGDGVDGQDGDPGRDGRDGSRGYRGSDGRDGRDGRDGTSSSRDGRDGEDGQDGDDGGSGGDGTDGTDGRDGTNGTSAGDGGDGGSITVYAEDVGLFMHVSASVTRGSGGTGGRAGIGGRGGEGGDGGYGGAGGDGGDGGDGGRGYRCSTSEAQNGCTNGSDGRDGQDGDDGRRGRRGRDGDDGSRGRDGSSGSDGWDGRSGSITLVQVDASGHSQASYEYSDRFNLRVMDYQVVDENKDGIFEPGETYYIEKIRVKNLGKMGLPAGGLISVAAGNDQTGNNLEVLPAIAGGQTYLVQGAVSSKVPANQAVGTQIQVRASASFRGLWFRGSTKYLNFPVRYPLQIVSVQSTDYLTFDDVHQMKIQVKNISTKAHDKIRIEHALQGDFTYQVTQPVSSIPAGQTAVEIVEYKAVKDQVAAYHQSVIRSEIQRDGRAYDGFEKSWQVVPSYAPNPQALAVLVVNHHDEQLYQDMVEGFEEVGVSFDLFDLRLNKLEDIDALDYKDRLVIAIQGPQFGGDQKNVLSEWSKQQLHMGSFSGFELEKNSSYKFRRAVHQTSYFELADPVQQLQSMIFDLMPFETKISFHLKYLQSQSDFLASIESAIIQTLKQEYNLARDEFRVYSRGEPHIRDFAEQTVALDPVAHFEQRSRRLSLYPQIDDFIRGGRAGNYLHENVLGPMKQAWKDLQELQESCGKLIGTYKNMDGDWFTFRKSFWGGDIIGHNADKSIELEGDRRQDPGRWTLKYKLQGAKHNAVLTTSCPADNPVGQLDIVWGHDNSQTTLFKISPDYQREP